MSYKQFFPPDPVIPSTVTKEDGISVHSPDADEVQKNDPNNMSTCGKWMLFYDSIEISPSRGLTRLDYAWQFIYRLVKNNPSSVTGLICARCTTSWMGKRYADPHDMKGVISCFTIDYHDKLLAKKAADAIRNVYDYPKAMYYKTDDDTRAMKYGYLGSKFVSIYKHTIRNDLFERDPIVSGQWNLVFQGVEDPQI